MSEELLRLEWIPGSFAVVKLPASAPIPAWALEIDGFCSITRTDTELSIVTRDDHVPKDLEFCSRGWAALRIADPVDFSASGILAELIVPLAREEISIFAISTYDTDVVLTKGGTTIATRQALSGVADVSAL